jgi:hypothetical protein
VTGSPTRRCSRRGPVRCRGWRESTFSHSSVWRGHAAERPLRWAIRRQSVGPRINFSAIIVELAANQAADVPFRDVFATVLVTD